MVKLEIFARNYIIPTQRLVFTARMRDLLFIIVCRHFAYGGTINKILPFKQEIEDLLADNTPLMLSFLNAFMDCLLPFISQLYHIIHSLIPKTMLSHLCYAS